MIANVETSPGAAPIELGNTAQIARTAGLPTESSPSTTSDSVAPNRSALVVWAYMAYAVPARTAPTSPRAPDSAAETDPYATPCGPQLALIRAALPSAVQHQFDAQLTAFRSSGRNRAAGDANAPFTESDLAQLLEGSVSANGDAASSVLIARLANDVARLGPVAVAQALHLAHERIAFPTVADTATQGFAQARVTRRERDGSPQRDEPRPKRDECDEPPIRDDRSDRFINDIVYYHGEAVAQRRTALPTSIAKRDLT